MFSGSNGRPPPVNDSTGEHWQALALAPCHIKSSGPASLPNHYGMPAVVAKFCGADTHQPPRAPIRRPHQHRLTGTHISPPFLVPNQQNPVVRGAPARWARFRPATSTSACVRTCPPPTRLRPLPVACVQVQSCPDLSVPRLTICPLPIPSLFLLTHTHLHTTHARTHNLEPFISTPSLYLYPTPPFLLCPIHSSRRCLS